MTTAAFVLDGERITGFTVRGHSGWAATGSDIVCAAVTSAVRLAECAVNDVLGLEAPVTVDARQTSITLRLPRRLNPQSDATCQTLLAALMLHLAALRDEYPDCLSVLASDGPPAQ